MGVVTFDPVLFKARYPEFMGKDNALLLSVFGDATLYLDNTDASRVTDVVQRASLLNMLVAHLLAMMPNADGSGLAGRITSATEGSVSVSVENQAADGTGAWFIQTRYGAAFWQATARYRTFGYVPGRSRAAPSPVGFYPGRSNAPWL